MENQTQKARYIWMLIFASVFWGVGYVVQKYVVDCGIPPGFAVFLRMGIGALAMFLVFFRRIGKLRKQDVKNGVIAGALIGMGVVFQTKGLEYTTVSNNAFITASNIIVIPLLSWFFLKQRPNKMTVLAIVIGFIGMCVLTRAFEANIEFNTGDILSIVGMVFISGNIVYVAYAVTHGDTDRFTLIEIASAAAVAFAYSCIFETTANIKTFQPGMLAAILYLGVVCGFLAYWMENIAQKFVPPSKTALIFSLEAVTASVVSILIGMEYPQISLIVGGGLIVTAIAVAANRKRRSSKKR